MSTWIWIVIAVVVLLVIAALVWAGTKKKQERDRTRAGELREQAAAQATAVQQREADARETEARAEQARAQAQRLEAQAKDKASTAEGYRSDYQENLQRADEMDPDVDTKSDDYTGPDPNATQASAEHRADVPDDSTVDETTDGTDGTRENDRGSHRA